MSNKIKSIRELFSRIEADGRAKHLLRSFNLMMSNGQNVPSVKKLANDLGFHVIEEKLPKNVRGRLELDSFAENGFRIEVNASDDVETRRWTVLHEVMHYFLHRRTDPFAPPTYRAGGHLHFYMESEVKEESEANRFVEALIFGDAALEAAVGLFGRDVPKLARHFGASTRSVEIALRKLSRA